MKKKPAKKAPAPTPAAVSTLQASGTVETEKEPTPAVSTTGPRQAGARRSKQRTRRGDSSSSSKNT